MRFGIMAMQMEMLVPPGQPAEQILASITNFDHAGLVSRLAAEGFNPIELGGDLSLFLPHAFSPAAIENLLKLKANGITYTVHLPLWSVEPSTPLGPVRRGSVEAITQLLQATGPLAPEVYVMHATGALAAEFYNMHTSSELARNFLMRQFQSGARDSLEQILMKSGVPSRRIALETIEFPLDLTLELADELDLSICLDTGHVLAGFPGWFDFFDVVEECLPRLAEIHLHDSKRMPEGQRGYGEDHKPLGHGDLDLGRLLDRLSAARFDGPIIFELQLEEALESLKVIKQIRPQVLA
ncbi:MAG TPA: cobamide remodeling phosphodiesterase CbiR [Anaerolineales bacterium]|nr:cobamide remodeling phosphodiesterase CbiR [Anaerolineales bacterium]